jgi:hypothetical protein
LVGPSFNRSISKASSSFSLFFFLFCAPDIPIGFFSQSCFALKILLSYSFCLAMIDVREMMFHHSVHVND